MKNRWTILFPVILFSAFLLITACDEVLGGGEGFQKDWEFENLPAGRKVMTVTNLSSYTANLSFNFNRAAAAQPRITVQPESGTPRKDMEAASRFNANPPPFQEPSSRTVQGPRSSYFPQNSEKAFWVTTGRKLSYNRDEFVEITAVLRSQGNHCNIWVDENCFNTGSGGTGKIITAADAKALADKFDAVYPLATNLLGYEYGGGPGGDGGIDGDPRVQILVYDIREESVVGFFWSKDEYTQESLNLSGQSYYKSNNMEIFYISSVYFHAWPELVYSTLIHEFQHMINFNQKYRKSGIRSATWYDEMLAMLAEDVIAPLIGVGPESEWHPIKDRIPLFLACYSDAGLDQWLDGNDVYKSYSAAYAFGAYLIRNYGGPELIKKMLGNSKTNQNSVTTALQELNDDQSLSFDEALKRYAEVLLYSTTKTGSVPSNKMSFQRTKTFTTGGTTYTAAAFDIWDMQMPGELLKSYGISLTYKGPVIFALPSNGRGYKLPGQSFCLHNMDNTTGNLSGTLRTRPVNEENIELKVVSY
jgi:hypothetical protein